MSGGAVLLPNFGAEEGEPKEAPTRTKSRGVLAPLWSLLFDDAVALDSVAALGDRPAWMGAPGEAAFPWLDGARGLVPWLSTERAAERARALSLPVLGPPPDVVARVSDKAWALGVAREEGLVPEDIAPFLVPVGADVLARPDEAKARIEAALSALPAWVESYTLKPRYGSSGRGRVAGRPPVVDARALAAFERLAARGGVLVEPWLSRTRDLSVQLFVEDDGVRVLGTTEQLLRPSGLYEGNRGVLTEDGARSGTPDDDALVAAGLAVGERARREGFRGPCGVDAFLFLVEGREVLRPVVELNARFTTGTIAVGMVERAQRAGRLAIGDRWQFGMCPPEGGWRALPGVRDVLALDETGAALAVIDGRARA